MALPEQGAPELAEDRIDPLEVRVSVHLSPQILKGFPPELARRYGIVPLARFGDRFIVASNQELRPEQLKAIGFQVGGPVHVIPADLPDVDELYSELARRIGAGRKLGDILTQDRVISEDELEEALERQRGQASQTRRLGEILVELGFVTQSELDRYLEKQSEENAAPFDPSLFLEPEVLTSIPEKLARQLGILPLARIDGELVLASGRELEDGVLEKIAFFTGLEPRIVRADDEEVRHAVDQCYVRLKRLELGELRLGEILMLRGLITQGQLDEALLEQKETGGKLGEVLIEKDHVSEKQVYEALAEKLGVEFRRFSPTEVDPSLAELLSRRFVERHLVLPLKIDEDRDILEVAMADPTDLKVRDMIDHVAGNRRLEVRPVLAPPATVRQAIGYAYQSRNLVDEAAEMDNVPQPVRLVREDLVSSDDLPEIKQMLNQILYRAVMEGASDVHIENLEDSVRVRFRVDGILERRNTPITKDNIRKFISVMKIDAGLDIAERRRSQDGVFKKRIGEDHVIDFRINVHASKWGEDAVIRILDQSKNLISMQDLGMAPGMLGRYQKLIENPQGLILFSGPTGSGKTTTLYSTLSRLNSADKKIVTAEDPVEYNLDGISQYQVKNEIGNTFAEYARRFLRKDPDIILIGEIRDEETADACVNAALTGHLVFSTVHTNDAVGVVQRLRELDVETASLGDALLAVVSQRLARRICQECRTAYRPDPSLVQEFFDDELPGEIELVHGKGCPECDRRGYSGRVGLFEFWEVGPQARRAVGDGDPESRIRAIAREEGIIPLLVDALGKVGQGLTTLEELRRVVPLEQIRDFART